MRRVTQTLLSCAALATSALAQGKTYHASVAYDGDLPNGPSAWCRLSGDGKVVAFLSEASTLVFPFDHNNWPDVYARDLEAGVTERISVGLGGQESNHESGPPSLSEDGRFVAFASQATNLVALDDNGRWDVFVADRLLDSLEMISLTPGGAPANGDSLEPSLSADGRYVAFASKASNLVGGGPGSSTHVYVRDRLRGTTILASVTWQGGWPSNSSLRPSLSANGRVVAFESYAVDIVPNNGANLRIVLRDLVAGTTTCASPSWDGSPLEAQSVVASISADGRYVHYLSSEKNLVPGDANGFGLDSYVFDAQTNTVEMASLTPGGGQAGAALSWTTSISQDGRWVAFTSNSPELVGGDTNGLADVFVRDRWTGAVLRASLGPSGSQADALCYRPSLSGDGGSVAFDSAATTLVQPPGPLMSRVFVRQLAGLTPEVYCTAKPNSQGCTPQILFTGAPSAGAAAPFRIQAAGVINQKPGLLFYGLGFQALPFQGAFLCVATPLTRTIVQLSGGNPPPDDCSGFYSFDFNAHIQGGIDPRLVAGTIVDAQYWTRDPADPTGFTTGLTDALHFLIAP